MPWRALTTLLATALLLAPPAAALADGGGGGAGDQQYQDPLNVPSAQHKKPKPAKAVQGPSTPAVTTGNAVAGSQSQTQPRASDPGSSQLPRTGTPAGSVALLGVALLACGLALRRYATAV